MLLLEITPTDLKTARTKTTKTKATKVKTITKIIETIKDKNKPRDYLPGFICYI
jgi:hypothetical protein